MPDDKGRLPQEKYVYEDPLKNGYREFKLSKKEHNYLFKSRRWDVRHKYKYFISDKKLMVQELTPLWLKIVGTLIFPIEIVMEGLSNYKETMKGFGDIYHQLERGKFCTEECWCTSTLYKEVRAYLINREILSWEKP